MFQSVNYSVLPTTGSTYNWTLIGGTITGQGTNSIDVVWNNSGMFSFSVTETDINGCEGDAVSMMVNVIISDLGNIEPTNKELIKVTDLLGRNIKIGSNIAIPFIKMYDDGTVEKIMIIE